MGYRARLNGMVNISELLIKAVISNKPNSADRLNKEGLSIPCYLA